MSISFISNFFTSNTKFLNALLEHVYLTIISLAIAIMIAIPLAIYGRNHPRFANLILGFTSIMQTIPSLAILGILIPIVGIGSKPAIIAWYCTVSYQSTVIHIRH
ncbi:L-proline glycine betaine binding ABC transporter protein ProX [Lentilactobacillus farraginis DSM 18382 = JCM 14108]|uniref:L-proline glycine betaine binding ABC transporter protein ProX n=1 Tax=Lentilactobacillus farraginis DSM 18382 = JCM 14108 TaxID=1423743 RepID=X0PI59_9LACO|nr:L-proline glycine betaine binding ABC transporter protein ProX [Lentilactobacillus farraginis DSM 18382 = JCM 14108]